MEDEVVVFCFTAVSHGNKNIINAEQDFEENSLISMIGKLRFAQTI